MTSFQYYLNQYRLNRCENSGFVVEQIAELPKAPKCTEKVALVKDFFTGANIVSEDISTCGGYRYKATIYANSVLPCSDFKQMVCKGLEELKIPYSNCDLKVRVPYYEVTITVWGWTEKQELRWKPEFFAVLNSEKAHKMNI